MVRSLATTVEQYIQELAPDRQASIRQLREVISSHLPPGFEEQVGYGMIGWVVPHRLFPAGYHCDPSQPLPFMGLAAQKNFDALYHMGLYMNPELLDWFQQEYALRAPRRLDMGKSCIRFKKPGHIPYELIGELAGRMSPQDWIACYQKALQK